MAEAAVGKALAPTVARLRAGTVKNRALCRERRREKHKVREAVWLNCMENYKTQAAETLSPNLMQLIYASAELCDMLTER